MSGRLFLGTEAIDVMEGMAGESYDLIYVNPPYFTSYKDFFYEGEYKSARHAVAAKTGKKIGEVTIEETKEEEAKARKIILKQYTDYISHVVENTYRLLKDDGIAVFLVPCKEYVDINYKLVFDQFFKSSTNVTIKRRVSPISNRNNTDDVLYFCYKASDYVFPVLKELRDIKYYPEKDDFDNYRKVLMKSPIYCENLCFTWHGIDLSEGKSWRFPKEKLDELYDQNRIVINDNKVFLKEYRTEHPVKVSTVWEAGYSKFKRAFLDEKSISRMFDMFGKEQMRVLCPYERDGIFSYLANINGFIWDSITSVDVEPEAFGEIPEASYTTISDVCTDNRVIYRQDIVANTADINALHQTIKELSSTLKEIQSTVGIDDDDEASIDTVIEKIHQLYETKISVSNIEKTMPEAQEWINPYWDKLEDESRHFIPMGILLYNLIGQEENEDIAPSIIEFCRTFEGELFSKMFVGYIQDLIDRKVTIGTSFPEAYLDEDTKVFAFFLQDCTEKYREDSSKWKFEIGKMAHVLTRVLAKKPKKPIYVDFRAYLNKAFEDEFFKKGFANKLDFISKLRNSCAHPSRVDRGDADDGKNLIREKLLTVLQYYKIS
ncbi:DNA methylase [Butyrivibrio sp. ob235]|uniref:DNA methyltransferase n=1 Tax=Butyrivibrio sp. ob235 TaxID=1761780 RepID=UPI0008C01CDD|nr:DNA methyltransferase [Butyrivibrio sp. ob235]SEL76301.1 DNA methylase [Butyrivibrio sp. ob235]